MSKSWFGSLLRQLWRVCILSGAGLLAGSSEARSWWDSVRNGMPEPSVAASLPQNGISTSRQWLADRGVVYGFEYTADVLSNVRGGLRTGTVYQGKLHGILTVDLDKLAGREGLSFYLNFFQIHNTGRMRRDHVGGINTIAAIEAVPATRLSELWLEQKFAGGRASLRFGQLAADSEFFFSDLSALFLHSDWPTIAATNLPSGGPAYPLSTPGVRFKFEPIPDAASFLFAVFNGDPAGPGPGDEQLRNRHGLNFRLGDPPLLIGEAQFRRNTGDKDTGLATTLKLGAWRHLGAFDDKRFAIEGTLLADPASSGVPARRQGNSGVYVVLDQQLFRPRGGDAGSGISIYTRASLSPSDRNLVDAYIDGGVVFAGMIAKRPHDKFGAGIIYARFSDGIRAFDRDRATLTGAAGPIRDYEANLELTYQAQIVPGWTVQPLLTFVWHPNGDSSRNATVVGARSIWRY
ncbi:MAG TPA: carbohydrate porin [Xanthobacteraceae bacterium]|nr:carbohydrate porin [Xanthobacteraceae bacterium]